MDGPFGWLAQLLGNQQGGGNSGNPGGFGALGASTQGPTDFNTMGPTNPAGNPMNINPQAVNAMPGQGGASSLPGLLGQFLQRPQNNASSSPLMNQAFKMMQSPQMTPTQWMPWQK
jgi:hypothetical protein